MAIVIEECTTKEQRSVVRFLWAKGLNAKNIHKSMFPVYGLKCSSRKAVHNCVENVSLMAKSLWRCGFRRTGKAMGRFISICDLLTGSSSYMYVKC
jgi:hypothetical protein